MRADRPFRYTVILGTNEIASAVAVRLHRDGCRVVMSHDPLIPVIRRKMAFHDALFGDVVTVDGIPARRADSGVEIYASQTPDVLITELGLLDLIVIQSIDILVDARMQKYRTTPDLRRLAAVAVGLGPGFGAGINCDIAVETRPGQEGQLIRLGYTDAPDGVSGRLGIYRGERFIRAPFTGRWNTAIEIGTRVYKDFVIGHLGSAPISAPFDGILRGVARDGTEMPAGAKLLEIDPRGRNASWSGSEERGRLIAKAVARAASPLRSGVPRTATSALHIVK